MGAMQLQVFTRFQAKEALKTAATFSLLFSFPCMDKKTEIVQSKTNDKKQAIVLRKVSVCK